MLESYRSALEAFHERLLREHYLHFAGHKADLDLEPIYADYSDLYRRETVDDLRAESEQVPEHLGRERKSRHRLLKFALDQHLEAACRPLTESIAAGEASARLLWNGRQVSYYQSQALLANEADRLKRRELHRLRDAAVAGLRPQRRERFQLQATAARRLGYESLLAFCSFTRGLDYRALARTAARLLTSTRDLYTGHLADTLRQDLQMEPGEAHRADTAHFLRLVRYDDFFPADRMIPSFSETVDSLGIDLDGQENLHLDTEPRPGKTPRAFCAPVRIPEEIRLVINPAGGYDDYSGFFHEGGHAQHYAWSSPVLPIEHRCCGDAALSEVYAFLFQHLISDDSWLFQRLNLGNSEAFIRRQLLFRLYLIRRYAAKVVFEVDLLGGELQGEEAQAARYASLLSEATLFQYDGPEVLDDLDDGLYAADYLRAWLLEAQLRDYLREKYGWRWHAEKSAGRLLKEIWETGELYSADELGRELGLRPGETDPLEFGMQEALRGHR